MSGRTSDFSQAPAAGTSLLARWSFALGVLACAAFTAALWISDNYLRYELEEYQYRASRLHHPSSARAFMRNVVKRQSTGQQVPNPLYFEALAAIEEEDLILPAYQRAYESSPANPFLLINYGCRLYLAGQFKEARERFREAGIQPQKNALPRYLEAAALAAAEVEPGAFDTAMGLVARANSSGDPVIFPKPLWHPSLPTDGAWYGNNQRYIVMLALAPLFKFHPMILEKARARNDAGEGMAAETWLEAAQLMGERIAGAPDAAPEDLGVVQTIAGLEMQLHALSLRLSWLRARGEEPRAELLRAESRLPAALERLKQYDMGRESRIEQVRSQLAQPLLWIWHAALLLLGLYALVWVVQSWRGQRSEAGPLPLATRIALGMGIVLVACALLFAFPVRGTPGHELMSRVAQGLWYGGLVSAAIAAFSAPFFAPCRQGVLIQKTLGRAIGYGLLLLCIWFLLYRLATGLYPYQIELLTPGFVSEEVALLKATLAALAAPG
jgi:hypothetical protein